MRKIYYLLFLALITTLSGLSLKSYGQGPATYSFAYTGSVQNFVVPPCATSLTVDVAGSAGGTYTGYGGVQGYGGRVQGTVPVTGGQTLYLYIGAMGGSGCVFSCGSPPAGGSNSGGGAQGGAGSESDGGAGGGGSSDIRTTSGSSTAALASRLVVGGGGSGSAWDCGEPGANGAYPAGATGVDYCGCYCYGTGGSQTAGGICVNGGASSGAFGAGGNAYPYEYGSGGGGGWYGGGGANNGSGGGGSSYASGSVTGVSYSNGYESGNGYIKITVPCALPAISGTTTACTGFTTQLSETATGGTGVSWTSGNTAVATVSGSGLVTGVSAGTAAITYSGTFSCGYSCVVGVVTIIAPPTPITGTTALCTGFNTTLSSSAGGSTWSSSNTSVATAATASATTGTITGVGGGSAIITYAINAQCYVTSTVVVTTPPAITGGNGCVSFTTNLSDGTSGGTWSSSNTAVATIGSNSGVVNSLTTGNTTITYTIPTVPGCYVTDAFTVNPLPPAITGAGSICKGASTYLSDAVGGGVGIYSTTSPALTIGGGGITGLVTGAAVGSAIVTYTLPTGCIATTSVAVLTAPSPITGASTPLCSRNSVSLGSLPGGGTWTSSNIYQATVDPVLGTLTGVSAGNPSISYTLSDGCQAVVTTTINNSPAPIGGATAVCKLATTTLTDATAGGHWTNISGFLTIGVTSGFVTGLNAGVTTVTYTNLTNGCYATQSFTVNALPATQTLSSGGSYCYGGSGVDVTLGTTTQNTVNYTLYNGAAPVGTLAGNGGVLDFGDLTAAGTYTVQATSNAGCVTNLPGSAAIVINPLPTTTFALTGGGGYCPGGGVDISLSPSQSGVSYTLWQNGTTSVYTTLGTGASIDFNPYGTPGAYPYNAGTYTVSALNISTGCQSNIAGSLVVNVYTAPDLHNVTGGGQYCSYAAGVHVGVDYSDPGITYYLFNGGADPIDPELGASSSLDFGMQVTGSYSVTAVNSLTGCTSQMNGDAVVSTYPAPNVYPIGGGGNYCEGTSGADIYVNPSDASASYQLYHLNTPIGASMIGNSGMLDFGNQSLDSTYTVVATDLTTGCYVAMSGVDTVHTLPAPGAHAVTGGGAYCAGGIGSLIGLTGSDNGISYQLWTGGAATGSSVEGTGGSIGFGNFTGAGSYTAVATNTVTGCTATMPGGATVTVNTLPSIFNVTGGGSYCSGGAGVHVGLDHSSTGIEYTLYNGMTSVASAAGSNASLDFGAQTGAGTYTVIGTNTITGCTNTMNGSEPISISPSPTNYMVTSTASAYCEGGAGVGINLTGSDSALSYQLYLNGTAVGGPVTGTGSSITFGMQTGAGAYTVIANNLTSLCSATMSASPLVVINPVPVAYTITGGGSYCAGGTGVIVGLSNTASGITYQLMSGGSTLRSITSTGGSLSFGAQTGAGWYNVLATNPSTSCTNNMVDSVQVTVNPLPAIDSLTGGGSYCAGAPGVHLGLDMSTSGVNYTLYNGSSLAGELGGSTGSSLDFGLISATGTYTVKALDMATGCSATMYGSKTVGVNALPPVYTMFGGGGYCAGTPGVHVNLSGSTVGVNYQLYYDGAPVGSAVSATGAALDFGLVTAPGNYTAIATDALTLCTVNMTGASSVVINPLPAVHNVTGGGAYCAGGTTGPGIGVDLGDIGFHYQAMLGMTPEGPSLSGGGMAVNLGGFLLPGTYTVVATNDATSCKSTMAGTAMVTTMPLVTPSVSLSSGTDLSICAGNVVGIVATATNGGPSPAYQWTVNSVPASTGNMYTYVPSNGDVVSVQLTSNAACATPATANASTLITVAPYEVPAAAITAYPGNTVCSGTSVTFNASTANGGSAPVYNWLLNSTPVGSGLSYTYVPANNDVLEFTLASNLRCRTSDLVFSNTILMEADQPYTPVVTLTADPGTSVSYGTSVTLHATVTNAGPTPSFQWLVNGVAQAGADGATFTSGNFNNNDSVTCIVTSNTNACGAATGTNSLIMSVNPLGVNTQNLASGSYTVVPNPNNGAFSVKGSGLTDEAVSLEVTDVLGQVVYSSEVKPANGMIDARVQLSSSVANGMYLLNVHTAGGVAVFHIVVEK